MYPTPASAEPPTKVSAVTVIDELAVSISNIWSLTGVTSFESGFTVNSILVEAAPLIFSITDTFNEFIVTRPVE